ncbi:MAG: glycosyltransferase family 1 protein [Anaerolineae bacterium]|nr:glycosyltransferase family 1 protein [Anaerolineae bacterium]
MASPKHLYEALTNFDEAEMERVFGREFALKPPDPSVALAPVKRVVIFAEAFLPKIDGVSKSAYLTLRYLQQTGREVLVLAPDIAPPEVGPSRVIALRSFGLPFAPETRVALPSFSVPGYLEEFKPDLIHMFSPALLSVSGMLSGRRQQIPVIANYQTDLPGYTEYYGFTFLSPAMNNWLRYIHNGCHLTLVPSHFTLEQLRERGYRRMRIWGRGVDGERFNPKHYSAEWRKRMLNGRDPDSLLCVYVGRLASEKRVDLLLDVAKTPGVALTIVGDGAVRDELETQFAKTGTYFMGYLLGDDLAHAFASADVFLFPGPTETFGQVVQEAMASGLPAVIINRGGITDLVTPGKTGYICPDDPKVFAEAVRTLRDYPDLRQQMARQARLEAEQRPWEAIMAQLESYYREAVKLNQRFNRTYPQSPRWSRRSLATFLQLGK